MNDKWTFYKKDGSTIITTISDYTQVDVNGKISKTFYFFLTSQAEYNNLLSLCRNVESYFVERTPLKGAILFVDKSPNQQNTIKISDPQGVFTGFGILESFTPIRPPGFSEGGLEFEITLLWMGDMIGDEIQEGVYKITLGKQACYYGFPYCFPMYF